MNLSIRQNHRHREQPMVAKGEWPGGRMEWEAGLSKRKLLCIGWINKILLHSTENYI